MSAHMNNSLNESYQLLNQATTQAKLGQFRSAEKTIASIPNPETRQLALGELVKQYVFSKNLAAALQHAKSCELSRKIVQALAEKGETSQALSIAEKINDPKEKSTAYRAISEAFAKARQPAEAVKYAAFVQNGPKKDDLLLTMRLHTLAVSN